MLTLIPLLIFVWVAWIVPLYVILGRVGFSRGWAFVALFPPFAMVMLWVIAFAPWPNPRVYEVPPGVFD